MSHKNIINILGINISILNKKEVLKKIGRFLEDGKQHQIVTPNPEFLLSAEKDEEFFYILNNADLAVPDGIGLKFAAWAMGKNIRKITGADLVKDILKIAREKSLKVAVVNRNEGLSATEDIERILNKNYPGLKFIVKNIERETVSSTELSSEASELSSMRSMRDFQPDILFCALGAPHQEKFIYHNLKNLPSVKLAIGVGGAFDFLTGKIKRAPEFMRSLGLEWLWRLFKQPWRRRRIYNAVIVFPILFFKWRFILPFLYRPNAVCILYRRDAPRRVSATVANMEYKKDAPRRVSTGEYKILLVQRIEDPGHWQLPQGGTDGEDIEKAGARELREELGTDKFRIVMSYKNLWKYKFGDRIEKYIKTDVIKRKLGHKGQKQSLIIAEFLGKDEDIKINFWDHSAWKWVDAENLINEVHPMRRESNKIFLEKFKGIIDK